MRHQWTKEEVAKLLACGSDSELRKAFPGVSLEALWKRRQVAKREAGAADTPSKPTLSDYRASQKERTQESETKRRLNEALETIERLEEERETLLQIKQTPQTFEIKPMESGGKTEATAVIVASDWHIEETVLPEQVSGLNEFNAKIAEERTTRFFQGALRWLQIAQKDVKIRNVVLALLGDFISGYLDEFHGEPGNNELQVGDAIWKAQNILISGIKFLLQNSDCEFTVPCHSGNHGRMTAKTRFATEQGNSIEVYMYRNIAEHFRNVPRIKFVIAEGYHTYCDIYGMTVRFHHGHMLKYGGGIGGIYIPVNKAIAQWNKARKADLDVFGHFHQFRDGGNFICNGSIIGYSTYALSIKAEYEPPKQAFFLINDKWGKNMVCAVNI